MSTSALLGDLVPVRAVTLGFEHPVQPPDVAVLVPVALPVELPQVFVALELGEHAVGVEDDPHLPADLAPPVQFLVADRQLVGQLLPVVRRQDLQRLQRALEHPHGHDVGVGVVAQPLLVRVRVALVVLVRAHHAEDLVAVELGVVRGDA
jgi:hypothetical protein